MKWVKVDNLLPSIGQRVFIYAPSAADESSQGFFAAELGHPKDEQGNDLDCLTWWCEQAWFDFDEVSHWMLATHPDSGEEER